MAASSQPAAVETRAWWARRRSREQWFLAIFAVLVGALSVVGDLGPALDGVTPAIGRVALGLLGVAAGVVFWLQPPRGWVLYIAWALIQIPVYAWRPEGSPTTQALSFPLSATSSTEVNGVVTSYSEFGVNLVGVILAIWLAQRREKLTRSD